MSDETTMSGRRRPLPRHFERSERVQVDSVVLVNTGDGKGKSSAAFGVMGRGCARGWRVGRRAVHERRQVGRERKLVKHLGIECWTLGDGFTWESTDLDESAAKNRHAWDVAPPKIASGDYNLLILDELTYVVYYGWVWVDAVVAGITERWSKTNVVITGRDAPEEIFEAADTVTDMKVVKHAYERRHSRQEGDRVLTGSQLCTRIDECVHLPLTVWHFERPTTVAPTAASGGGVGPRRRCADAPLSHNYVEKLDVQRAMRQPAYASSNAVGAEAAALELQLDGINRYDERRPLLGISCAPRWRG